MMKPFLLLLLSLSVACPGIAAELRMDLGHGVRRDHTQQLLQRPDARNIVVPADVAFHRTMHYRVIPL